MQPKLNPSDHLNGLSVNHVKIALVTIVAIITLPFTYMGLEILFTVFPTTSFNTPIILVLTVFIPAIFTYAVTSYILSKQAAKWTAGIVIIVGVIAIQYVVHAFSV